VRIVRFQQGRKIKYGALQGQTIKGLKGSPFSVRGGLGNFDGSSFKLTEVRLLAPCVPSKLVCIGLNYRAHAMESGAALPPAPLIFLKPTTAIINPEEAIILPRYAEHIDYEGELGIVIGRKAKDVSEKQAKDYALGYVCFDDVSDRVAQNGDGQWTRAKGYDTFAPVGPWIETDVNPDKLKIETYLNGKVRQSSNTNDLIFGVSKIISYVSQMMTLLPGDVIATGTPSGVGQIHPGDVVEVKIEKIGTLKNPVVAYR
jgi:2-keto-4-pentenoate hydratase/2-oxohepta-3-ene-1,7-dioic acid hydratase in catechol pathway